MKTKIEQFQGLSKDLVTCQKITDELQAVQAEINEAILSANVVDIIARPSLIESLVQINEINNLFKSLGFGAS
jgi:hypothetical protein